MNNILGSFFFIVWVAGFVIAKGFWSTLACIFAPYSWYLVIELVMIKQGVI